MAEIQGPAPEALSNDDIIRKYDSSLSLVTKAAVDQSYEAERQILINQAKVQWLMVKGQQSNALGFGNDDYGGQMLDWVPFDGTADDSETGADIKLCPPVNFIGGDAFKFMAVMGSSSPRVKAVADDLRSSSDAAAARCADTNIHDVWLKNKIDRKWKIPAFHLYTTGPCFIRGFWNTDSVKYGSTTEPEIEISIGPDGIPMPRVVGTRQYANGDAEVSFHSVLEVSIPWEAKELRGNPLKLERMLSKWSLISKYAGTDDEPGPLDKYRDSDVPDDDMGAASTSAAEARQATSTPSGTGRGKQQNQWRFTEWWIPPHLYESITSPEARRVIKNQFQRGLYMARVGSITVEIDDRDVTDEWAVCCVNRGEKIMERPVCADGVPLQNAVNDLFGMAIETVLRAITQTLIDNTLIDRRSASTKESVPAEIILTPTQVEGRMADKVFQIPPAHLSDQVLPLMQAVRSWWQDISGVRPELSGGGAPTQTYREAKQRKDQALAQLAPQAQSMRDAAEDLARILVNLRAKYGNGTAKSSRRGAYGMETDVAEMSELQADGWHPESDDQFPLTLSDTRDAVFSLLKDGLPPEVLNALGLLDPMNVNLLCELMQVPGFQSAIADQIEKTLQDVEKLLQAEPTPGMPGPDGKPGPPQPSIVPDPFDNHPLVASMLAKWMISPVGQKNVGTPGFANVQAFWNAHNEMATPPPPPMPPALKGSLSWAGKLEDFPSLVPEILEGAGLSAPPPAPAQPPGPPAPMGTPAPMGPAQPLPPMPPAGPQGPPPMVVPQ